MTIFDDPFLADRLNPFLLATIQQYWRVLDSNQNEDVEEITLAKVNLLRFAFRKLFQPLFLDFKTPVSGAVYFLANIHGDGVGDYFALLKSAMAFKLKCPTLDVHIVYRHQFSLPKIEPADYLLSADKIHGFYEATDFHVIKCVLEGQKELPYELRLKELKNEKASLEDDLKETPPDGRKYLLSLLKECESKIEHLNDLDELKRRALTLYQELKKSLALVNIALSMNTFDNPELSSKSLYFAEAGNFSGIGNYFAKNWFGMGLEAFDEGVFLKKTFPAERPWKDEKLTQLLFGVSQPNKYDFDRYFSRSHLYLGYQTRIKLQQQVFIYLTVALQVQSLKNIDVVMPKIIDDAIEGLNEEWLRNKEITKVVIVDLDKSSDEITVWCAPNVEQNGEQKTLRIIHQFPLPSSDFEKLVEISEAVVGCTGDLSLSECIATEKIPYYELRKHKLETWQALKTLAMGVDAKLVVDYLQTVEQFDNVLPFELADKLAFILMKNEFKDEWGVLCAFIKEHYCLEDALVENVLRFLGVQQYPEIIEKEMELVKSFLEGTMNAQECFEAFKNGLRM